MRHLDLFSGIGGFALAASWVWGDEHEIVGFCEIDSFCQTVLKKHWPDTPIYPDIKELKGEFNAVELITGGFPCQPYSVAGKQKGAQDDRAIWPEMFRVIREARPRWVIAENVPGIVNMELDTVLSDLESEGYTTETFIIPACAVDAPHRRDRVWIVGYPEHIRRNAPQIGKSIEARKRNITSREKEIGKSERSSILENSKRFGWGRRDDENGTEREIQTSGSCSGDKSEILADSQEPGLSNGRQTGIKAGKNEENGRMAFPGFKRCSGSWWAIEPELGRVANGIPDRVDRLKSLGNAIVPQVAAVIMRGIRMADKG